MSQGVLVRAGHGLGLSVVAEGVETPEQLAFLVENGCDEYQGFIRGRPLRAEQIASQLVLSDIPRRRR